MTGAALLNRRRLVPVILLVVVAVGTLLLWRPLVAWFAGKPPADGPPAAKVAAVEETGRAPLSAASLAALQKAFAAHEEVRALLAADTVAGIAGPARVVAAQLRAAAPADRGLDEAARAADRLAAATSLDDARQGFGEVTRHLVALAASDPRLREGWHLFECPMTKTFPKWFQRDAVVDNPYMGPSMPTCGSAAAWQEMPLATTLSHEGHGHRGSDPAHYTCSMHPSVKQKSPGSCPICAMPLTPVTYDESEGGVIIVDDARRRRIRLETRAAQVSPMTIAIRAVGRLTYDETRLADVTLRVGGWVSKLRVATGEPVAKGQTLFSLYSPDLFAAQQEYLLARGSQTSSLVGAAEKKLRLWGMTRAQIAELDRRREPIEEVPIPAPAGGYVIEKNVVEGAAVEPGQRLYRIAGLDRVWVEAEVYELDLARVAVGGRARVALPYRAGEPLAGTVSYVYPYLDPASRTGKVRIEVPNRDLALKPDMYARVELEVDLGERLQVPIDSVVYTGPRRLVFVDVGEDRLRPQEVTLGARDRDSVEIVSGLRPGQRVVTSGNFLIAAESRIRSSAAIWSEPEEKADGKR